MIIKFEETTIPQNYVGRLEKDHSLGVEPKMARFTAEILLSSIAKFLTLTTREEDTALIVDDESGNLLLAGILSYHKGDEESDMPGNYSFVLTVNDDDLKDIKESNKYSISDNKFIQVAGAEAYELHSIRFVQPQYAVIMLRTVIQMVLEWLDLNAKEGEELSVELDGYFIATVGIEDGEKIISITPDGALKRKIKDDAGLEEKKGA